MKIQLGLLNKPDNLKVLKASLHGIGLKPKLVTRPIITPTKSLYANSSTYQSHYAEGADWVSVSV